MSPFVQDRRQYSMQSPPPIASVGVLGKGSVQSKRNNASRNGSNNIQVAVRIRPFLSFESGNSSCLTIPPGEEDSIKLNYDSAVKKPSQFTFDSAFDIDSTQNDVFEHCVMPLISACINGHNATVLAYGQTGSGKTHTILGDTSGDGAESGIIPRALDAVFSQLPPNSDVKVQFLELYGEEVRDLLSPKPSEASLTIRDGDKNSEPVVLGATHHPVSCAKEALLCLSRGMLRRVVRSTAMNSESSRSHAILTLELSRGSKFHFVDLAGSERIKRTNVKGKGLKEGININKGLLVLGNVISALASSKKQKPHVPYRDSKLTRLLKGSLGGRHKTLMIACVSPSSSNVEETLNTLRYANRAKQITNKVKLTKTHSHAEENVELKLQMSLLASVLSKLVNGNDKDSGEESNDTRSLLHSITKGKKVQTSDLKHSLENCDFLTKIDPDSSTSQLEVNNIPSGVSQKQLDTLKQENETLTTQLNQYKEEVVEQLNKELEQTKQELSNSLEEIIWLKDEISVLKSSERVNDPMIVSTGSVLTLSDDNDFDDNASTFSYPCSVLTDDNTYGDSVSLSSHQQLLSRDTFETVKNVNQIKVDQIRLELKDREDERDKIAITLCSFKSERQCMTYVKTALSQSVEQYRNLKIKTEKELEKLQSVGPPTRKTFLGRFNRRQKREEAAKNASASMISFYSEKLSKLEKQITSKENSCKFVHLSLDERMSDCNVLISLEQALQQKLTNLDNEIKEYHADHKRSKSFKVFGKSKQLDEEKLTNWRKAREELILELKKIDADAVTMTESVVSMKKEQNDLEEQIIDLKHKHVNFAKSVSLPSIYNENENSDEENDGESVISMYSVDSVSSTACLTHREYNSKLKALKNDLENHIFETKIAEEELSKIDLEMSTIEEMKNALTKKLEGKETEIEELKRKECELINQIGTQEKEISRLVVVEEISCDVDDNIHPDYLMNI